MFLRLIPTISVGSSMKGLPKCFILSLHRAGQKQRRCSTVSSSSSSLQLLQKSFFVAFSLPACVPTSQWPVRARTRMPHSVRLNLSSSEIVLLFITGHVWWEIQHCGVFCQRMLASFLNSPFLGGAAWWCPAWLTHPLLPTISQWPGTHIGLIINWLTISWRDLRQSAIVRELVLVE